MPTDGDDEHEVGSACMVKKKVDAIHETFREASNLHDASSFIQSTHPPPFLPLTPPSPSPHSSPPPPPSLQHGVAGRFALPPSLVDLLERMLAFRPRERLSLSQVSSHPWVITHPPTSPSKTLSPPPSTSTSSLTSTSTREAVHVSAAAPLTSSN